MKEKLYALWTLLFVSNLLKLRKFQVLGDSNIVID
jgi:hypothetical protein